jgi:PAS domain S-box-containing protein
MGDITTIFGLGIVAIFLGVAVYAGALALARWWSYRSTADAPATHIPAIVATLNSTSDAVVIARRSQVVHANDQARQLFGLNGGGEPPNLSLMAQLAHPQDVFYDLFAAEGQAHLTIDNRPLEATSIRIPGEVPQFVVTLRPSAQLSALRADRNSNQGKTLVALSEATKTIAASLDLQTTAQNILETVNRVLEYDIAEVTVWDADTRVLRPLARDGNRVYTLALDQQAPFYRLDEGLSGWLARNKRPLLIADIEATAEVQPKLSQTDFPFQSMVGVPLLYGEAEEFVGTIEIASLSFDSYTEQDVALLETLAGPATVAIRNAQRFAKEETRVAELSGIAQVAQTAAALADPRELYANLTRSIAKLLNAQLCGFLLYDEAQRALISQPPFYGGVPEAFLELYRITVSPGSVAERIWREQDYWYTNDVYNDPTVAAIGLKELAESVGVRATILVPLIVGGQRLGVVQVSNKLDGTPFDEDDVRLLRIFAGPAAVLIDNARLVREAEERVRRAEALRQISEITGSARDLPEIYREVMTRTAKLVRADLGVVLLLDAAKGEFEPQPGSVFGGEFDETQFTRLRANDPAFNFAVTMTRRPFYTARAKHDRRVLGIYRAAIDHYQIGSAIVVPLVVQERGIGEVWFGAHEERRFARADLDLAATVASQLASAVERSRLASATDETLRRRVEQLTALTRVGRELNQTLELESILQSVYDEAVRTTGADGGHIILLDHEQEAPTVRMRLGTKREDSQLDPLELEVALSGASYRIGDLSQPETVLQTLSPASHQNINPAELAVAQSGIRSLLIAPIVYQGTTVGIIELHSRKVEGFGREMMDFSQALAAQAAIAVGNAQRYVEQLQRGELLRQRADQLTQLLQISRAVRSDRPLSANLEAIAYGLQEAVGFNVVLISVLDPDTNLLHRTASAGVPIATFAHLKENPQPWHYYEPGLTPEFQISQSYYISHDRTPPELNRLDYAVVARSPHNALPGRWHEDDYLFVPLIGSGGQTLGLMSLDDPRNGRAPDRLTVEAIEIFANQAALAIENAHLFQESEKRASELSQSLAELQKSYRELDTITRSLTRKERELNAFVEQTELRARRLLALHRIASDTAEARTETGFLQRIAEAAVKEMELDVCLIALVQGEALTIVAKAGAINPQDDFNILLGQLNPLSQIVELHTPLLARDLGERGWGESRLIRVLRLRSFMGVPIFMGGKLIGASLLGSRLDRSPFSNEDIDLFTILASQIGVGIENIRLDHETQQQMARNAQLLAETRELQAFNASIFESIQQGLAVLDTDSNVLSFNGWIRQTFGWTETLVGQNLFDYRPLYRDLGLADSVRQALASGAPMAPHTIRDSRANGSLIISNFYGYPLRREGQVSGVVLLVEDVTTQTRLEADVNERASQLRSLIEVSRVLSSTLRPEDVIKLVLTEVGRVIPYDSATLWLRDGDFLRVAGARGFENDAEQLGLTVQLEDSRLFREMSESQQAIAVPDVRQDARFPAGVISRTRSWLGAPLVSKNQVLGLLAMDKVEEGFYTASHAELSIAFASQAAVALDNARLFEERVQRTLQLNERSQRLALLNRISSSLNTTLEFDRILDISVREISKAMQGATTAAVIYDEASGTGNLLAEYPPTTSEEYLRIPLANNPLVERLQQTLAPVLIDDVAATETLSETAKRLLIKRGVKAVLIVPLIAGGQLLGYLNIDQSDRGRFRPGEIELAQTIANQTAIAIQNARLFDETQLRLNELTAINRISHVITATFKPDEIFAALPEEIGAVLNTGNLYLALYDASRNRVVFPLFYENGARIEVPPQEPGGVTAHILRTRQPLLLTGHIEPVLEKLGARRAGDKHARSFLGVPLLSGERALGVIAVQDLERENVFDEGDERILSTIAAQLAVALENSRLFAEADQRRTELATLFDLGVNITQELDLTRLTDSLFDSVQNLLGVSSVSLAILSDRDTLDVEMMDRGQRIKPQPIRRAGNTFTDYVLNVREPLMIGDLERDTVVTPFGQALGDHHRAWLGVPLIVRGSAIGVLAVQSDQPYYFGESHMRLLNQIGNQFAIAIDNARLFAAVENNAAMLAQRVAERTGELEKERDRVEILLRITNELSASLDLDRVLSRALGLVNEVIGGTQGGLFLLDAQSEQIIYRATLGVDFQLPPGGQPAPFRRGEGLVGWVIRNRQPIIIPDLNTDERWIRRATTEEHRSAICVPLVSSEDALGAMIFYSDQLNAFTDDQLRLVTAAANQVTSAINNAELYRLIRDQAERLGGMLRANQVEASKSRAILESVGDGVMVTDPDGKIIFFNATAERILRLNRSEVENHTANDFMGLYGAGARTLANAITRWSRDPSSYQPGDALSEQIELEDGRIISVLLTPVTSTDEYIGSVSIFRDITREVELDRLKTEFVSTVSHELRTPMTPIQGFADLLLRGVAGPVTPEQQHFLRLIKSNADRLRVLVDDLLDISKLESGKVKLDMTPVSVSEVMSDVTQHLQGRIAGQDRSMNVVVNVPPDLPPAWGDRARIAQIITNLADNAFTYSHPGGTITLSACRDGDELEISVADTGIGISSEEQGRVFERFYRGEDTLVMESAGTGLGLSIVKQLVDMHGGKIWVKSEGQGRGSTFHVRFKTAPET